MEHGPWGWATMGRCWHCRRTYNDTWWQGVPGAGGQLFLVSRGLGGGGGLGSQLSFWGTCPVLCVLCAHRACVGAGAASVAVVLSLSWCARARTCVWVPHAKTLTHTHMHCLRVAQDAPRAECEMSPYRRGQRAGPASAPAAAGVAVVGRPTVWGGGGADWLVSVTVCAAAAARMGRAGSPKHHRGFRRPELNGRASTAGRHTHAGSSWPEGDVAAPRLRGGGTTGQCQPCCLGATTACGNPAGCPTLAPRLLLLLQLLPGRPPYTQHLAAQLPMVVVGMSMMCVCARQRGAWLRPRSPARMLAAGLGAAVRRRKVNCADWARRRRRGP